MKSIAFKNDNHIGFQSTTDVAFDDIKPQYSVNQLCNFTVCYKDNSIEEVYHFITQYGYSKAYSKILGRDTQIQVAITFVRLRNIFGGDIVLIRVPVRVVLDKEKEKNTQVQF